MVPALGGCTFHLAPVAPASPPRSCFSPNPGPLTTAPALVPPHLPRFSPAVKIPRIPEPRQSRAGTRVRAAHVLLSPLFEPTDALAVWSAAAVTASGGLLLGRTKVGALLSGPVCAMLLAAILTNFGLFPAGGEPLSELQRTLVKVATPLLLISADLKRIYKDTGILFAAFLLGSLATAFGSILGFWILAPVLTSWGGEDVWRTAAALSAKNIGGGLNYVAVADTLGMQPSAVSTGLAVDNVCGLAYFPLCSWLAGRLVGTIENGEASTKGQTSESTPTTAAQERKQTGHSLLLKENECDDSTNKDQLSVESFSCALALSIVVATVSEKISMRLFDSAKVGVAIETVLMPVLATLFSRYTSSFAKSGERLGTLMLFLFFGSVGMAAGDWFAISNAWPLLVFNLSLYIFHLAFLFATGKSLFKFRPSAMLIASNANIGNAATASAFAKGRGWGRLVVPALLVGTLGNAIGTFGGLGLGAVFAQIITSLKK